MMIPIRSLTPQQATGNALAAGFKENRLEHPENKVNISRFKRFLG
jgi:hypothetical protein